MKKLFTTLTILISPFIFSQITKDLGEFNKVTSFDKIDVTLIQSNENKIILNGSGSEDVEILNKNGELKIRMPLTKIMSGDDVSATVYFKKIEAVEANEGSRIACNSKLVTTIFDIITKEGSEVKLTLDVDRLTVKASGGSNIDLKGTANNQDVVINSGSVYDANKLQTNQTIITANAGGEADVFATNLVDAKVRAGGNITIFGNPKQINQKIIAGGKIIENKE
jgi:Putative auto-transporter adhesin, head GIN domain